MLHRLSMTSRIQLHVVGILLSCAALAACSEAAEEAPAQGGSPQTAGAAGAKNDGGAHAGGTSSNGGTRTDTAGAGGSSEPVVELHGRCAAGTRIGDFSAVLEPEVTVVRGQVWNAAVATRVTTEVAREGDCWLVKSESPHCETSCAGSEVCSADARCVPAPASRSVGKVVMRGLLAAVEMSPLMPGNNYFVSGDFPEKGFDPGSAIALEAAGGDVSGFSLHGVGVENLELPEADWVISKGHPFTLSWSQGSVSDAVVRVSFNVDQHGSAPVNLACETADDGELTVDAKLIDALIDAGVTGFPSGHVTRETVDSVSVDSGCIELSIGAHVRRGLGVEGYVACTKQADCPDGKTCNLKLQRCE